MPVLALATAVKTTGVLELAATGNGLAGFALTPEGRPLKVT
ncbi:MAG TPA: hypothetical protein VE077_19770 [Candidatus Methylomirabilis sp.]|nr:hypothetical protein [Candidatus Methylomirabilis sp.]